MLSDFINATLFHMVFMFSRYPMSGILSRYPISGILSRYPQVHGRARPGCRLLRGAPAPAWRPPVVVAVVACAASGLPQARDLLHDSPVCLLIARLPIKLQFAYSLFGYITINSSTLL